MHMAWIFWFANYPIPINRLLIVRPHADFCFRNCGPCVREQASTEITVYQFSWGKLEFPPQQSASGINLLKQETGTNVSLLKSQPQREWELIFKKMVLGEGEDEQG